MLLVETYLAPSPIHGIGLFAAEKIKEGTTIWRFEPGFDLELSEEQMERLSEACRQRVGNYTYYNAAKARYILCSDDARFINHSGRPNMLSVGFEGGEQGRTVAARDVDPGEELTEDYGAFEDEERNVRYGIRSHPAAPAGSLGEAPRAPNG